MKRIIVFLVPVALVLLTSCGPKLFTPQHRANLQRSGISVKDVQFFNSQKIVLERQISSSEVAAAKGTVNVRKGVHIESIIFPKRTPGRCVSEDKGCLTVAFEPAGTVLFCENAGGKHFRLMGRGGYIQNGGQMSYAGQTWTVQKGATAKLKFRESSKTRKTQNSRRVKGMSVN
ncbi:MAG: hypothetical protein LBH22_02175 [Bacteroidales bacterium]|jgi:hypothetical protein|nr:hypothetical protein [Bacteroidales bacterium]